MNTQPLEKTYTAFLPVSLLAASVMILLSWNLIIVISQHSNGLRISAQQDAQMVQASQTEVKMKQIMTDLVDLAETDTDAQTIVKRYGIKFTPPADSAPNLDAKGKETSKPVANKSAPTKASPLKP